MDWVHLTQPPSSGNDEWLHNCMGLQPEKVSYSNYSQYILSQICYDYCNYTPIYHILTDVVYFKWFFMSALLLSFFLLFFLKKKSFKTCHVNRYEMVLKSSITLLEILGMRYNEGSKMYQLFGCQ
jgi:sensor histidine kinase YesM